MLALNTPTPFAATAGSTAMAAASHLPARPALLPTRRLAAFRAPVRRGGAVWVAADASGNGNGTNGNAANGNGNGKLANGQVYTSFTPPGRLTDLRPGNLSGWSDTISSFFDASAAGNTDVTNDAPRHQFFNPTKPTQAPIDNKQPQFAPISWKAFPRRVLLKFPDSDEDRWRAAESTRDVQDEYCEWSVDRNAEGKITRITVTCEGPEYWAYLAATQPDTVVQLYQQNVNPAVTKADLFDSNGKYITRNKWNTNSSTGAMHLVQRNNTLSAEIELAAGASIVSARADGSVITDSQELIQCAKYGVATRFSDPFIGASVNQLARGGALIAVADPAPDGTDVSEFWTWTRGADGLRLRAVFEVPAGKCYVVGDIQQQSDTYFGPIKYGAQIIDFVKIKLTGLAFNLGPDFVFKVNGCVNPISQPASALKAAPAAVATAPQAASLDQLKTVCGRAHGHHH
ncbi:hypothetical protein ABPG75_012571 [Micractinium tetrahymenae]